MVMTCHYEALGVEKSADSDSIKKAYRKLALKLHPDKNLGNAEQATQEFRVVQQAYDVLSDSQERAWYDKHRDAILKGGMGKGDEYQDDSIDIYAYFNSSCYSGYYDDDEGFYSVYRKVFVQISDEDAAFVDSDASECELPNFGDSLSDFNEVVGPFYGYWESYCTAKSYVWCEKWDTRDGPDRMTRRAMEQENKKLCEAKKKERNEEIRALVAFVKKRDRRVIAHKKFLEEKAVENARLVKERRLQDKKEELRNMDNYTETEWSAMSNLENHLQALENNVTQEFRDPDLDFSNSEEELEEINNLFCVVCNKAFKTDRAFANHEKSKKHKENVALVREEMMAEDELLDLSLSDEQPEEYTTPSKLSKKQKKKRKQQQKLETADSVVESVPIADQTEVDVCERLDNVQLEGTGEPTTHNATDATVTTDTTVTATATVTTSAAATEPAVAEPLEEQDDISDFIHKSANKNKGKKKAAASAKLIVTKDRAALLPDLACKVCQVVLPTRNKLFDHIKETGHTALKNTDSTAPDLQVDGAKCKRKSRKK